MSAKSSVPTCVFECEYRGVRHAGTGLPADGAELTLYPVAAGQLREALLAGGGPQSLAAAVTAGGAPVTVAADDPDLRFLPPLLPTDTNNSLLTGFMGTHRSKFDRAPAPDEPFRAPNWLIKGFGSWTRMPGETLTVPASSVALLEEPEVALVFANDAEGLPHYAGYTFANDLNDIGLHQQNPWGWTPYAKLCDTSMTPWLFLDEPPADASGRIVIERGGQIAWEGPFTAGSDGIYHRVPDMVENLLSYPALHKPGLVSYLLLGSDKASWHAGFRIADEDRITLEFTSHGVVLSNPVRWAKPVTPAYSG
ncbi:fumarylacetoacetate (FAA) hydrolase [Actinacidiphila acididurans]|uniref:Fumarylacetoacetate (FAA) hydrolase n=1 Tax=Actinacidiphila acididurans TaxID=2784346 RepID=A0ABS2TXR1_9ACTN|nr:fumarylacetoacetate (FAA) hydrolase [Actinacidiphila acididurans]MBM9507281.1 fumarylacetoacetate (FAA) hydrolase [Actinacidiphila acididurans]